MLLWKNCLKMIVDAEKLFELCFPQSMNTQSSRVSLRIFCISFERAGNYQRSDEKIDILVGWLPRSSSITSICEASAEEGDSIILTCQGGISLKDSYDPPVLPAGFLDTPEGSLSGHWVLGPGTSVPAASAVPCAGPVLWGWFWWKWKISKHYIYIYLCFVACGTLVPWPRIEP